MAAANFNIPPPAKFDPKTDDWDHWIKRYELFEAATERDGLSDKVRINTLIYVMGNNAADIYDSFKLSGEDIQNANDNLSLDQIIKEVKSAEITKHQDQILQNNSSAADICQINDRKAPENKRQSPKPKHFGGSSKTKHRSCYRCGAQPGHPPQRCPAKDSTCNACNKKGSLLKGLQIFKTSPQSW